MFRQALLVPRVRERTSGKRSPRTRPRRDRMPQRAWSNKRERQYEHIKEGEKKQGRSTKRAKEIAARTVNKERARKEEARESPRTARRDISSGRRGGQRSGTSRPKGRTNEQLHNEPKRRNTPGRATQHQRQQQR